MPSPDSNYNCGDLQNTVKPIALRSLLPECCPQTQNRAKSNLTQIIISLFKSQKNGSTQQHPIEPFSVAK